MKKPLFLFGDIVVVDVDQIGVVVKTWENNKGYTYEVYVRSYNKINTYEVIGQVRDTTAQLCNLIGGNSIKVKGYSKTISKEEYEDLLDRDRILSALEAGGVDNWEWYSDSLSQFYSRD